MHPAGQSNGRRVNPTSVFCIVYTPGTKSNLKTAVSREIALHEEVETTGGKKRTHLVLVEESGVCGERQRVDEKYVWGVTSPSDTHPLQSLQARSSYSMAIS